MWCELFNISEGPWYLDLAAIAGAITSIGIIWRLALWPGLKTFWLAITAAPRMADGIGKVVELIEGDVLTELVATKDALQNHLIEADERASVVVQHGHRIEKLEDAVFANRKEC